MVLEKTLESPVDCKEIQPVHSEGDQPWDFFGRNDAKAETPVLCPPDAKTDSLKKTLMLGGNAGRRRRGRQRMRCLDGITDSMDVSLGELREMVMPSSHLILCRPLLLLPPTPPSIRVFSNESTLRMRWPKYWTFSFSISPSKEHPGLISFRMD